MRQSPDPLAAYKAGGYALSVFVSGEEFSTFKNDIKECDWHLNQHSWGVCDRYLIISTATCKVEIYLHPRETLLEALEQSQAELDSPGSYFDVGFDSQEQEALARRAVPELIQAIKKKLGL